VHITSAQLPRYKKLQFKLYKGRIGEVYNLQGSETYSRVCVGGGRRLSNAINARIATQSREAQAFGIQKVEESGSGGEKAGVGRKEKKWEGVGA
jgi:hypothetical protein